MVSLVVDTRSFVDAGERALLSAGAVASALGRASSGLAGLSQMAGSDPNGLTWAAAYDKGAGQIFSNTGVLQNAARAVARKLAVTGYFYELVETTNAGGNGAGLSFPAPASPALCLAVASAAGGRRVFPNPNPAFEWVAEQVSNLVGEMWPDGDTGKLDAASKVWHRLADDLDAVATGLTSVTDALEGISTPELSKIHTSVSQLRSFATKLASGARQIGSACTELSGKIRYVHAQTEITVGILIATVAPTAGASLGLTVVTFGISDAVGAAAIAGETGGAVATIMGFIAELSTSISSAVGGIVAASAEFVGIGAEVAAGIGTVTGGMTAGAVMWGIAGAGENTIVTGITEPGSNLADAAADGFIEWGAGGALGGGLGKAFELVGGGGKVTVLVKETDAVVHDSLPGDSGGLYGGIRRDAGGVPPDHGDFSPQVAHDEAEVARRDPNTGNLPDGSWEGQNGQRLDPIDNATVQHYAADAVQAGAHITPRVQEIVRSSAPSAHLVGLDESVKLANSLKGKVSTSMMLRDISAERALENVKDSIRYTAEASPNEYVATVENTVRAMQGEGMKLVKFSNTWANDGYKGINSSWVDPATGKTFELQFHTPSSFEAKTASHDIYEQQRLPNISESLIDTLDSEASKIFSKVEVPSGAVHLDFEVEGWQKK